MKDKESSYKTIITQTDNISLIKCGETKVLRISHFLSKKNNEVLYNSICKEEKNFKSYEFPGSDTKTSTFLELGSKSNNNLIGALTQKAYNTLNKQIIKQLPSIFNTLDINPFPVTKIPLTFVNCSDGHYGAPHADSTNGQYQISILYYFNSIPKVFKGGDLQVFKTDTSSPERYNNPPLFTIDFENNSLIIFASETFHGITKVKSDSDDFSDGRFIAVGFLSSPIGNNIK
ncbi:hypothetical protein DS884_02345 [Tenacibaculum sp. E3R01]|uniref:2OG-Fe(II) oxygenase n=1 Tax=Tenacibaculum sp. E3R01 TaxID=2267227 RepID=UPI000DEAE5E8|nr:2OG-Fe(II) oxygenase [Tenacibaculum sp. E3R01]RBW62460.1 hypothetical protein DS884_02345 [Tenacibaculum sp. E3R01]